MRILFILWCLIKISDGQYYGGDTSQESRFITDPELAQIPQDIINCYLDVKLWDRYSRLPSSIESLVALLRKVELHPAVRNWTPGRLAADLVHKFRFDGIHYDRCIDTSTGAVPLKLDLQAEFPKMQLIWKLVDGDRREVPDDILEPHEKCALHWMISYSVNTTFRDEEYFLNSDPPYGPYVPAPPGYQNDSPIPPNRFSITHTGVVRENIVYNKKRPMEFNCDDRRPQSFFPLEMGVVWSRAGPVTAGTVLTGLAAGLRPQFENWPTTGQGQSRRIDSVFGVTLAADLAQTALLKRRGQSYIGPDGYFNNSLCPSEFLLTSSNHGGQHYGDPTFTHMTVAEINGGIDGLLLGMNADDWERQSELSLSQVRLLFLKGACPGGNLTTSVPDYGLRTFPGCHELDFSQLHGLKRLKFP
jgi:hypothetical protein